MGYSVKIFPPNGRSGFLFRGALAPVYSQGTYYDSPSAATKAAKAYVSKMAGRRAQVVLYRTGELVEEFISHAQPKPIHYVDLLDPYALTEYLAKNTDPTSEK